MPPLMSGAAPPAPPSSPAVLARTSDTCSARYLRSSAPTATLIGLSARGGLAPASPLMIPRVCDRRDLLVEVLASLTKSACAGVIVPSAPNTFKGTQLPVVVMQLSGLVASSAWR